MKQFVITPAAGKRLIGKAIARQQQNISRNWRESGF